jgi:hypothetical protein
MTLFQYDASDRCLDQLSALLKPNSTIIIITTDHSTDSAAAQLRTAGFNPIRLRDGVILAMPARPTAPPFSSRDVIVMLASSLMPSPKFPSVAKIRD